MKKIALVVAALLTFCSQGSTQTLSSAPAACQLVGTSQCWIRQTVDFSVSGDKIFTVPPLPSGVTRYNVGGVRIGGASADISAARVSLVTGTSGVTLVAGGTAITVTASAAATNNNSQLLAVTNGNTESYGDATLKFNVGTTTTGTATVAIQIIPF